VDRCGDGTELQAAVLGPLGLGYACPSDGVSR